MSMTFWRGVCGSSAAEYSRETARESFEAQHGGLSDDHQVSGGPGSTPADGAVEFIRLTTNISSYVRHVSKLRCTNYLWRPVIYRLVLFLATKTQRSQYSDQAN